jgi:hypothetical protein
MHSEITGNKTGNFLKFVSKSSNSAQKLQILLRNRELTGNFGKRTKNLRLAPESSRASGHLLLQALLRRAYQDQASALTEI